MPERPDVDDAARPETGQALAAYTQPPAPAIAGAQLPSWAALLPHAAELARVIAGTEFVPKELRGRPAAVAAAIIAGQELGLSPLAALNRLHIIEGRVGLDATTMRALVLAAGHDLWLDAADDQAATVSGRRAGSDVVSSATWSMQDAQRAGLAGKPNWRAYPRQMLTARATAELCRTLFPDVLSGLAGAHPTADLPDRLAGAPAGDAPGVVDADVEVDTGPELLEDDPGDEPDDAQALAADLPPGPGEPTGEPTPGAFRALHAAYRDAGMADRGERLTHASQVLGRQVDSSRELDAAEVSQLLDALRPLALPGHQPPPDDPTPQEEEEE